MGAAAPQDVLPCPTAAGSLQAPTTPRDGGWRSRSARHLSNSNRVKRDTACYRADSGQHRTLLLHTPPAGTAKPFCFFVKKKESKFVLLERCTILPVGISNTPSLPFSASITATCQHSAIAEPSHAVFSR